MSEREEVLLEAHCRGCEMTFDVWASREGDTLTARSLNELRCPQCMVVSDELREKDSLI